MNREQRDTRIQRPGNFLGLKFQEGWWFVEVLGNSSVEMKPFILQNGNGNRQEISSTSAGSRDEIQDQNSDRILEPDDNERSIIHQVLVGVAPSRMQVFPFFGREQNLGLEDIIETGEDVIWFNGFDSPYNNPSLQSELFVINSQSPLKLQAFNPTDTRLEARVSFFVNKLLYGTVEDVDLQKALLQNQIPCHKHMMGLGETEADQIQTPNWLDQAFGSFIRSTTEILTQGDVSQARQQMGNVDFRSSAQIGSGGS